MSSQLANQPEEWSGTMRSRDWKYHLLIVITVGAACALFLWQAIRLAGGVGFPLDDAWIHARFADNLANGYGPSYNPGIPSPGSTSPLRALLLGATYLLGIPPIPAALFWGVVLLILRCWAKHYLALVVSQNRSVAVVAAVLTMLMTRS